MKALTEDGIAVTQCESIYFHQDIIKGVATFAREIFPVLHYYYTLVPTYPSGMIGFFFCSRKYKPLGELPSERYHNLKGLRYYTPEVHRSAFTLPRFASDLVYVPSSKNER